MVGACARERGERLTASILSRCSGIQGHCDIPELRHGVLMGAQGDEDMDTASGAQQAYPSTPGLYHLTIQAEGQTAYAPG